MIELRRQALERCETPEAIVEMIDYLSPEQVAWGVESALIYGIQPRGELIVPWFQFTTHEWGEFARIVRRLRRVQLVPFGIWFLSEHDTLQRDGEAVSPQTWLLEDRGIDAVVATMEELKEAGWREGVEIA